jgi:hypothetical protein
MIIGSACDLDFSFLYVIFLGTNNLQYISRILFYLCCNIFFYWVEFYFAVSWEHLLVIRGGLYIKKM